MEKKGWNSIWNQSNVEIEYQIVVAVGPNFFAGILGDEACKAGRRQAAVMEELATRMEGRDADAAPGIPQSQNPFRLRNGAKLLVPRWLSHVLPIHSIYAAEFAQYTITIECFTRSLARTRAL